MSGYELIYNAGSIATFIFNTMLLIFIITVSILRIKDIIDMILIFRGTKSNHKIGELK